MLDGALLDLVYLDGPTPPYGAAPADPDVPTWTTVLVDEIDDDALPPPRIAVTIEDL